MSEELKDIKKRLIAMVQNEVFSNAECVDTKELGEVIDMIKDISETIVNCDIAESMEKSDETEKQSRISEYMPQYKAKRFYQPMYYDKPMYDEMPTEYMRDLDRTSRKRMYFTDPNTQPHDSRDGRAYISRRYYIDAKNMGKDSEHEMEKYIQDLSDDIIELIEDMDTNEKAILRQKIAGLANKIS